MTDLSIIEFSSMYVSQTDRIEGEKHEPTAHH
jgi:hypothetical protein